MSVERDPRMRTGRKFAEHETLDLLRGYGLSTPRYETVEDVSDAVEAAGRVGYPIVLKVSARGLMHKTELGFVRTGLWTEEHIEKAASELLAASTSLDGPMKLLVVEMVRGDLEVFVGYKRDRDFGPTILFGFGGIWTEIIDEVTLCVGGADRHSAERLIVDHRIGRMVQGGRAGMLDMEGIASAICLVSAIGCAHPEIKELDVNPLIVGRDTSIAVDATVRT